MTFEERFRFFLDFLDILECVGEREAHTVRQHEGTKSTKYSKPSEETEWNLLWNLAQLDEEFPNDGSQHAAHPGDGGAGPHGRVPDGGGVELGGVHEGHVEGGSSPQFGSESQDGVEDGAGLQECSHYVMYQVMLII